MKKSIMIAVRVNGQTTNTNIDVDFGDEVAEYTLKDLGKMMTALNPDARIDVKFCVFSEISRTWMEMMAYYTEEDKVVKF